MLSAVEGLRVASPHLARYVVPSTILILGFLFAVQSRGSRRLGRFFGAVMVLWLGTAGVLGAVHLVEQPAVLAALSPLPALRFLADEGPHGFRVFGGVVLSVTGAEALYADMGHFGRRPMRVGWYAYAFPMLVLCYLGQGAWSCSRPLSPRNSRSSSTSVTS